MARMTVAGHSVHAIVNDWPIALFTTSLGFDAIGFVTKNRKMAEIGYYTMLVGYWTGAIAAVTGIAEYRAVERKGDVKRLADRHAVFNTLIMIINGVVLARRRKDKETVTPLPLALSFVSNCLTVLSAWYGDEMVYGHKVRVQDQFINPLDHDLRPPGDEVITEWLRAGTHPR